MNKMQHKYCGQSDCPQYQDIKKVSSKTQKEKCKDCSVQDFFEWLEDNSLVIAPLPSTKWKK